MGFFEACILRLSSPSMHCEGRWCEAPEGAHKIVTTKGPLRLTRYRTFGTSPRDARAGEESRCAAMTAAL